MTHSPGLQRTVVAADGTVISWTEYGSGPPVLLIMGLGADGSVWERHVDHLRHSFRCIAVDNRGTGASDSPPGPYSTALMAADCISVLDAAQIERAHVVGISMGGAIAQQLALNHPERVDRLVLTASWGRRNPYIEDAFTELRELRATVEPRAFARRLQLLIWSPEAYSRQSSDLRAEQAVAEPALDLAAFQAQCDACVGHDLGESLRGIRAQTLVTAGGVDAFTPLGAARALHAAIPQAQLEVFPDGGHAHHWEFLTEYNHLIERFLHDSR